MNKLSEQKIIEQFINSAVRQTYSIFNPSYLQMLEFKDYFEDMILFEIISCKSILISFGSKGNEITDNLKIALIASGISKDGSIPNGSEYSSNSFVNDLNVHVYAKKRAKEFEKKLLGVPYKNRNIKYQEYLASSESNLPNPYELVELGIARRERESGYIQESECPTTINLPIIFWNYSDEFFKANNLSNTLAYEICSKINDSPEVYGHFSLATNMALRKMAKIDFYISTQGLDSYNNKEELLYTLRNIKAAKITDRRLIEPFEKRFVELMSPYMEKEGIVYEVEDTKKLKRINSILSKKKKLY